MRPHHFPTVLKGIFFSFILFLLAVGCIKKEEEPPKTPTADFSFTPVSPKVNEEVTFTNTSKDATSYQWSAAGTSFSSKEKNPKFTFDKAGEFEVKLVAKNSSETHEVVKKVIVKAVPVATFSFSPSNPEVGKEVSFTNKSTNATSYQWSAAGTSFNSTEKNPKFTFDKAGNFQVKLVAKNSAGTHETTKQITVKATQSDPVAAFSFSPSNPEVGKEVSFTNQSTNATSYQWSVAGTSFNSTEKNPKFTFDKAGNFQVKLVAKNSAGKTHEITKQITVKATQSDPVAAFSFSPSNPEVGKEVSFTNKSTNATSYQWSAAGTSFNSTEKNPKFTFDKVGDFQVKLVAKNSAGKTHEVTKQITVKATQSDPVAAFSFSPSNPEVGKEVSFTNKSTNATSYQWSAAGTSFNSTEKNPKFTFDKAGNFQVKLVAKNSAGKTHEVTKQITVKKASDGGGNANSCNLPECYVIKTITTTSGVKTTITYGYAVINGTKMISSVTTASVAGTAVANLQYNAQGKRIKDETKIAGVLQSYVEYKYSDGGKTVRANTYTAAGVLTAYTISKYDANNRLTRFENYTSEGVLKDYAIYSDFLNVDGDFPQLTKSYDASGKLTGTNVLTYENCMLKSSVLKDGSGNVTVEINNTIDVKKLLRKSTSSAFVAGVSIVSTTEYIYDCD